MTRRELLELIKRGELSPEQGLQRLQALASAGALEPAGDHAEPSHAESSHAESSHAEPSHAESSHAESSHAESSHAESSPAESSPAESSVVGQAVLIRRPGTIETLELATIRVGAPGPGQVRVRTRAFSLNFGDLLSVRGLYPTMPPYPFTPGFELAGVIDAIGPGVTSAAVGDEVIAVMGAGMGAHASVVLVDASAVIRKPNNVSFAEACATPVAYLTAEHALSRAQLREGETILIQSAAGGVGLFAVQLALGVGATIYGTASTATKLDYLRSLGVHHPINYVEHDFHPRVLELSGGRGVDVVLNTLAGDAIQKGLDLLAPGGRYVEIAMSGLKAAAKLDLSGLYDNQSFISVDLRRLMLRDPELTRAYIDRMVAALDARAVLPTIGSVLPIERVREAYALLGERGNLGKVVIEVPAPIPASLSASPTSSPRTAARVEPVAATADTDTIAVIGMGGRFPGGEDLDAFWANLSSGRDCVAQIPRERWDLQTWYDPDPQRDDTTYCQWGGVLDEVDRFDPAFFDMTRREAELCEPQQRLFLETSWHALEHAGYASRERGPGRRYGVFVGASSGDYVDILDQAGSKRAPQAMIGNESSVIAGRIAYALDLTGPAIVVNTACSASLVAIHLACESLRAGSCELALAGGVFVSLTPAFFVLASNAHMLSPTGRCRSFANDADGFVPGEGVGVVVLKPLAAAQRDGDRIYGIIRASGINQDGRTNALTAPSPRAQTELLRSVHAAAGISPRSLDCVEAHGTGTRLGDPVEVDALTEAFRSQTNDSSFCALGSVKSNIGHAVTAAGVASVLKMLLALEHEAIPPTLHAEQENEHINFATTPFFVNRSLRAWPRGQRPRRAGVSSFGFCGTNAHLVLEEAPRPAAPAAVEGASGPWLFPLSGTDDAALARVAGRLGRWLSEAGREVSLADLSFTLQRRRAHLDTRAAI
ncbi:beta-ketoacyl synthase N-terminal-like domain-containing protein, partial [Enhygromyxa salina]|uniref:beta-ketoacyl synthase N-terminal-like domain-containing protein n=1 Tax=Enhygromyxa salina TaxID=215803 RepID=UPI0011BAA5DA